MKAMTKKAGAILLALALCLSLCCTALAAQVDTGNGGSGTITIEGANNGETYSVYKMLNLTYDATNDSYAYTVATDGDWYDFFTGTGFGAAYFDVDANGGVTLKSGETLNSDSSEMAALAQAALAYAKENSISADVSGDADQSGITFTNLTMGWYLVDTSLGSLCSIDTLTETVTINEKNSTPAIGGKEVKNDTDEEYTQDDSASVGDTLSFEVFITGVANSNNLILHDAMTKGLTFTANSVKVYYAVVNGTDYDSSSIDWAEADSAYWTAASSDLDDSCTFEVTFDDTWLGTLAENTVIKVVYSAVVNEDAVSDNLWDPLTNRAHVSYGDNNTTSTDVTTETDTVGFTLSKVNSENASLSGAEFTLYTDEACTTAVQLVDKSTYYEVATADQVASGEYTTTITAGSVSVKGLAEGTYYLKETKAPDGYNQLTDVIQIQIEIVRDETTGAATGETVTVTVNGQSSSMATESNGEVTVVNNSGSELPSTGGIGTTIFYIIGGVLVAGAVVVLVTRRRMTSGEN